MTIQPEALKAVSTALLSYLELCDVDSQNLWKQRISSIQRNPRLAEYFKGLSSSLPTEETERVKAQKILTNLVINLKANPS